MPTSTNKSLLELEVEMVGWDTAASTAADLDSALSDLERGVEIDVTINADDSALAFDEIPDEITPEVSVTETEDSKKIVDALTFIAFKEKVEWIVDIAGSVLDFMGAVQTQFVDPFLDVEDAVARINAQTGTAIPDMDQLIRDLQAADLGDSVEQIADVVIHAQQIGAPMREAAEAAFTFTHTFDENPQTVLDSLNTMVTTKLTPSLAEAADLMTVFFQQGGNVGGDALTVVNDNAQSWADMGLTAAEALSTIDSLQQGTGATATDAAKMLQTFDDALTAAAADPASQQASILKMMGIDNPKDIGAAIGAETIDGFAGAFDDLPSDQQDLVSGLFFGKGGKKFTGAIEGMTTQNGIFADVVGAAEAAATEIDNSLRGAIDDFVLEINTSIARLLSSDEIDLQGKIADLKEGFQKAAGALAEGGSIGDALSAGFHIEGVDTALTNIERVFGNLIIAVLEIVATIQDISGKDSSGTRSQISSMGAAQLAFDLQIANPEEFQSLVDTALSRGVDQEKLNETVRAALDELTAEGNFGQVVDLVDQIISEEGITPENIQLWKDKYIAPLADEMDAAVASGDFDVAKKIADAQGDPTAYTDALKGKFGFDAAAFDQMAADFAAGMETAIIAEDPTAEQWFEGFKPTPEVTTAITKFPVDVDTAMTNASLVTGLASQSMIDNFSAITDGVTTADEEVAMAITGNTMTTSFETMASSAAENAESTISSFQSILAAVSDVDAAMSSFFDGIMAQVGAVNSSIAGIGTVPTVGAGGGNTTVNNTTVNTTNNVQSNAQAAQAGYTIAQTVRGMA